MENIIEVKNLTMSYQETPVLFDVNVNIIKNSITAIVGPNGAGKSTFIKGILNLMKPISGSVLIMDQPIKNVLKNIAYVPQTTSVNWDFPTTVFDVVLMGRYVHLGWFKRPTKKDKELALNALDEIGLLEFKNRHISCLSGGQRQRVFLARAIVQNADIYFLDEPLAGVDKISEKVIMDTLKKFQNNGKTIIVVHHDLNTVEEYFDHIIFINKRVLASGKTEDVFNDYNLELTYGKFRK